MSDKNYSATFTVEKSPDEVFEAINNVRKWWGGNIEGVTDELGGEFVYRYGDLHRSTQKVTELVPGKKVAWHVTEGFLSFVKKDKYEWKDTDIVFDISQRGGKTVVHFTHVGLVPQCECYDACENGWDAFVKGSLRRYIETGMTPPDPFAKG